MKYQNLSLKLTIILCHLEKNDSHNLSAVTTEWEILNQNFAERSSMYLHSFPKYKKIIKII